MKANQFKQKAQDLISQFEDLLQSMPQKGNTSSECQNITIQIALNKLDSCINGVEDSDFDDDDSEETILNREILKSYGFKQRFTTPDHDDRGIEFTLPNAVLEGLYICNNEPCELEMIEGNFYTDEGEEHYVCIQTKEQLDAFIALKDEEEIIEFINNLMN